MHTQEIKIIFAIKIYQGKKQNKNKYTSYTWSLEICVQIYLTRKEIEPRKEFGDGKSGTQG